MSEQTMTSNEGGREKSDGQRAETTSVRTARERFGDALSGSVLREAVVIVLVSAVCAGVVNTWYHPSPLPYIYESRKVEAANDTLFESLVNQGAVPTPSADGARATVSAPTATTTAEVAMKKDPPAPAPGTAPSAASPNDKTQAPKSAENIPPPSQDGAVKLPVAVNYEQVMKLLARPGSATFIDARKVEEHEKGSFPGSLNVDVLQFQANPLYRDECMRLLYSLPKDKIVVAYCGGGNCELSHELCDIMIPMGFTRVFIYLGGWNEYKEKQGLK
jgi:rhodanese-related sulfurtransferase